MEIETKVETYRIDKKCDKCNEGVMRSTGQGPTQWGTQWEYKWEHKCDKCGDIVWFENKTYPTIAYRDIVE